MRTRCAIKTAMIPHSTTRTGEYTRKYVRAAASASMDPMTKKMPIPKKSPMSHRTAPSFREPALFLTPGDAVLIRNHGDDGMGDGGVQVPLLVEEGCERSDPGWSGMPALVRNAF